MHFSTLSSIARGVWLLDASWAELHAPLVARMLLGEEVSFGQASIPQDVAPINVAGTGYKVRAGATSFSVPEGSVAVLDIAGPLIRYGEPCGAAGMEDIARTVRAINSSPDFIAGVIRQNCPGGEANGTDMLASEFRNSGKPWLTCVDDGISASGGLWLAASTLEIYATNAQSAFGSIGAYCAFPDFTEQLKKKGIKMHEIYATKSTDKNKHWRDAQQGEYAGIQGSLDELVELFIDSVKNGRGERLNTASENPFTGKMYRTEQAMQMGLIDGIMSLPDVIARAQALATKSTSLQKSKPTMAKTKENKYPALAAAAGWKEGYESTDEGLHVNHDEAVSINAALAQGSTDAATVAENATAISAKDARIVELEGQVSELNTSVAEWKGKAEKYGAKTPNSGTTTTTTQDKIEDEPGKKYGNDPVTKAAMALQAGMHRK